MSTPIPSLAAVIQHLHPTFHTSDFSVAVLIVGGPQTIIKWPSGVAQPTEMEIADARAVLVAAQPLAACHKAREAAYPPIGDQLDALWHAMDSGAIPKAEPMYSAIKAVKDANPKPA